MFGGDNTLDYYRRKREEERLRRERDAERKKRYELEDKYRRLKYNQFNLNSIYSNTKKTDLSTEETKLQEKLNKIKNERKENEEKKLKKDLKKLEKLKKEAKEKEEKQKIQDKIKKAKELSKAKNKIINDQIDKLTDEQKEAQKAIKEHEEIRKKQMKKQQKWEDLPEDRVNKEIIQTENELVEEIRQTFFQAKNTEMPYYPFFMDPLQKGWSKKKTLWVNEQFNNKLLGENWFRNTPAQAVVESKVPDDNRNDFWYSIYGTIYDLGIRYCDLLEKFPQNEYWNLFLQCYFQANEIRDTYIDENYVVGNRIILFVDQCKIKVQKDNIIDAYNMFFNDKYKFICSCE